MKSILALVTLLLIASCGSDTPSSTSTADTPATVQASDQPLTVVDDAPVIPPLPEVAPTAVAVEEDPVAVEEEPVAVEEDPVAVEEEPVAGEEDPVAFEEEPVAVEEEPVAAEEDATVEPETVVEAPVETPTVDLTAPDLDNNGIPYLDKPVASGTLRASSTSSLPEDCPADIGPTCDPFTMMGIILEIRAAFVESAVGYGLYLRGELIENFIVSELPPNQTEIFYSVSTRIIETGDAAVDSAALQAYLDESIYQLDAYDVDGNGSGLTDPVIWVRGND